MIDVTQGFLRDQLLERQRRLQLAIAASGASAGIIGLLNEVDAALTRMEAGTYGICEVCNEPVEPERLMTNPLLRLCLPHLTEEQ